MKVEDLERHCESVETKSNQEIAYNFAFLAVMYSGVVHKTPPNMFDEKDKRKFLAICEELIDYYAV